jgi:predicted nucleic acid-binding protein
MSSALAAAVRRGRLNAAQEKAARAAFADLWRELTVVEASEDVVAVASDLARIHALRGYDAMQLGTAVAIRGATQDVAMITWDDDLANGAVAEGINVVRTTEN